MYYTLKTELGEGGMVSVNLLQDHIFRSDVVSRDIHSSFTKYHSNLYFNNKNETFFPSTGNINMKDVFNNGVELILNNSNTVS
jgi:hypothetical protein